jgi:hypothetical protein
MLTSFFSKSKPINFIAVILFMAVFFIIANFQELFTSFSFLLFAEKIGVFLAFFLSVVVLDFIAKKNDLTLRSAYKIIIFAVFSVSFWAILKDNQIIVANLCVLFALRRIISLKTQKEIPKKIFDATFWICIASLFYFWAILFLIIVYIGILLQAANYFKNWLIPIIAFFAVFALVTGFHLLVNDQFYSFSAWFQQSSFKFEHYQDPKLLIPLSIILALALWTLFYYFKLLKKANINSRPTYFLVFLTLVVSIGVSVFSPVKNGSELLFFFAPLSIITSNYFESKEERVFKEVLLIGLVLMPILIPIFF